jgi:ferredoxin, 2Fe-2S
MKPSVVMSPNPPEHKIVLEPAECEFHAAEDESLMHAAQRAGIDWPTVCGGNAQCGVCYVELLSGESDAKPPLCNEEQMLARLTVKPVRGGHIRLACQLRVHGDVRVYRRTIRVSRHTAP